MNRDWQQLVSAAHRGDAPAIVSSSDKVQTQYKCPVIIYTLACT